MGLSLLAAMHTFTCAHTHRRATLPLMPPPPRTRSHQGENLILLRIRAPPPVRRLDRAAAAQGHHGVRVDAEERDQQRALGDVRVGSGAAHRAGHGRGLPAPAIPHGQLPGRAGPRCVLRVCVWGGKGGRAGQGGRVRACTDTSQPARTALAHCWACTNLNRCPLIGMCQATSAFAHTTSTPAHACMLAEARQASIQRWNVAP